jgi:DNA repair protein RadA/Sms
MSKVKSSFFCQSCGSQSPKWLGKCPSCGEWNTFVEEMIEKPSKNVVAFSNETKHAPLND